MRYEEEEKVQKPQGGNTPHTFVEPERRPTLFTELLRFPVEV